jgi:acetyl esterase
MPLDPRARRFLQLLAAGDPPDTATLTVAQRRAGLAELLRMGGPGPAVGAVAELRVAGASHPLAARVYTPHGRNEPTMPGLVYFHGGGLLAGSIDTHDAIARDLTDAGRCRVVSIDYRLAPEHPFPAALEDAESAVRHIAAHAGQYGIDAARLGICGDSAGATLAAATCQALAGTGLLCLQVLICPILDYAGTTPSRLEFASGYLLDEATLAHDLLHYLARGVQAADRRVSPLRAAHFGGLPPALIHTAEFDPLRDEGLRYAEQLCQAGNPARYHCHAGMIHLFYGLKAMIPAAGRAFADIGGQIQSAFG